ncbi:MAG TPA: hypothetical protein VLB89_02535 [Gaiellaceae bacterium]|nr:hypothetical protein [Gaiellaceae bacterium]
MKRVLILSVALAAVAATAAPAGATNECRGLQICVKVPGPWVVVPVELSNVRAGAQFQLSCPRGYIVGGLDAELSDRAIDLDFPGLLGSPVGPGTTTSRAVVFRGVYTGASARNPVFRPHIGCVPTSGGGRGPVPYRKLQSFPPGQPTVRRVRSVRLRAGVVRAVAACSAGERLISGWHSVGFYTAAAPTAALARSVTVTRRARGNRVEVRARSGAGVNGVRAVVQVGAVCGGGS